MDILELIKLYKVPYKFLAEKMGVKESTFRNRMSKRVELIDEDREKLRQAVEEYGNTLIQKVKIAA